MRGFLVGMVVLSVALAQSWSEGVVRQLVQEGILYGYPDGALRLDSDVKRGEVVAMLWRLILRYRLKDLRDLTKEDIERLKGLVAVLQELQKEALESKGSVASLANNLKNLEGKLAALEEELRNLAGKGVQGSEEALVQIKELYARLSELEGGSYKAQKDFRETLATLAGALRDVDAKVKALEEAFFRGTEENRNLVASRFTELSTTLSQVAAKVSSFEVGLAKVADLERKVADAERRLTSVEEGLKAFREEVRKLREEMPRVRRPKAFTVGAYLSGLDSGFALGEYATPGGLSLRVLGAWGNPGLYFSGSLGYRFEGEGIGYRLGLGLGHGFYGPGLNYGELSVGLKVDLIAGLSLGLEGLYSYPLGAGSIVSRLGTGVIYSW
ncbi:MAG: S-layer homology domain-containing protein [Thermus sp.]|nr:S-layer homology domain-containing protein [Thermus sp.]